MDDSVVDTLCEQLPANITHVSADKMYDTNAVYRTLDNHFPNAEIAIPPKKIPMPMSTIMRKECLT